jgi:hypothetical protein
MTLIQHFYCKSKKNAKDVVFVKRDGMRIVPSSVGYDWKFMWVQTLLGLRTFSNRGFKNKLNLFMGLPHLLVFLINNPKFTFLFIMRSRVLVFSDLNKDDFPLRITSSLDVESLWISRQCSQGFLVPNRLDESLELSFYRHPKSFEVVLGNAYSDFDNLTARKFEGGGHIAEIQRGYCEMTNARILHGEALVDELGSIVNFKNLSERFPFIVKEGLSSFKVAETLSLIHIETGIFVKFESNWFHFLTETAIKIWSLPEEIRFSSPVIVPDYVPKQLGELCFLITGVQPIKVKIGAEIMVNKCLFVEDSSFKSDRDFSIRKELLLGLRNELLSKVGISQFDEYAKIYVVRSTGLPRPLQNRGVVKAALLGKGFKVVDTSFLSLKDQIAIFSRAEVIVIESGAACTNLIFCSPRTKVIELATDYTPAWLWEIYSRLANLDHSLLVGKRKQMKFRSIARDGYQVSLNSLSELL